MNLPSLSELKDGFSCLKASGSLILKLFSVAKWIYGLIKEKNRPSVADVIAQGKSTFPEFKGSFDNCKPFITAMWAKYHARRRSFFSSFFFQKNKNDQKVQVFQDNQQEF